MIMRMLYWISQQPETSLMSTPTLDSHDAPPNTTPTMDSQDTPRDTTPTLDSHDAPPDTTPTLDSHDAPPDTTSFIVLDSQTESQPIGPQYDWPALQPDEEVKVSTLIFLNSQFFYLNICFIIYWCFHFQKSL